MKPPRFRSVSPRVPYICNSCLSRTARLFSSSPRRPSLPPAPPPAGYAQLPTRGLLAISGSDSSKYLQGSITSNITPQTQGLYTAFLNAQGRLLNDVFIYPFMETKGKYAGQEAWLIEADSTQLEVLNKHIKRYRLRSKFESRIVSAEEMRVWQVWDEPEASAKMLQHHGWGYKPCGFNGAIVGYLDGRAPAMGTRLILEADKKPQLEMEEATEMQYRIRRYLNGVPEGQSELISGTALPQESNIDYMGGIDYRKGCYLGQELTIRTHHRGVVRKRILPMTVYGIEEPEPQIMEYDPEKVFELEDVPLETGFGRFERRGRSTGKWLAGVGNIGLGLCRLENMTELRVPGSDVGSGLYKEGDEFVMKWGEQDAEKQVKVQAWVPKWHSISLTVLNEGGSFQEKGP